MDVVISSSSSSYVVVCLEVVTTLFVVVILFFLVDNRFDVLSTSTVELSDVVNHPLFSCSFGTSLLKKFVIHCKKVVNGKSITNI